MATPGEFLINNTIADSGQLLQQLEQARRLVVRVTARMEALGTAALQGYQWPTGYTQADFVALYQALDALPRYVLSDDTRNKLIKLIASIQ